MINIQYNLSTVEYFSVIILSLETNVFILAGASDFASRLRREQECEGMALRSHLMLDDSERSIGPLTIPTSTAPQPMPPLRTLGMQTHYNVILTVQYFLYRV